MICGVSAETSLFSTSPYIDPFTRSSPSYYLKSISATLPHSIFHSIFLSLHCFEGKVYEIQWIYKDREDIHNVKLYFE